jgi:hypothetical protein
MRYAPCKGIAEDSFARRQLALSIRVVQQISGRIAELFDKNSATPIGLGAPVGDVREQAWQCRDKGYQP